MKEKQEEMPFTYDVIFVGATLETLNVLTRLPEKILKNSLVVDSDGLWLSSFRRWIRDLSIDFVRCPINVHPSPKPLALRYYAEKHNRTGELFELDNSAPLPSANLFSDFCDNLIAKLPANIQKTIEDTVVDVERVQSDSNEVIQVAMKSGRAYFCKSIVCGFSGVRPVIPKWIQHFELENHPKIKTLSDLDLCDEAAWTLHGKTIAILGGGLSAGTIALRALALGAARVFMISRRQLYKQNFDCDPGWWGMKYLNAFRVLDDIQARLIMCKNARDRGSLTPNVWNDLVTLQAEGKLNVVEGVEVDGYCCDEQMTLHLTRNHQIRKSDASSLDDQMNNTWFSKDVFAFLSRKDCNHSCLEETKSLKSLSCDEVWIACGNAFDVREHPLLSKLMSKYPINNVGGYPDLTSRCSWPSVACFVPGRGSMLTIGPCAANMVGMKMSADLISPSIQKYLSGNAEDKKELDTKDEVGNLEACFDPVNRVEVWWCNGKNNGVEPVLEQTHIPLERENIILHSYCKGGARAKNRNDIIDIQDLDERISRFEIQSFAFMNDGFKVSIVINLPERIPRESVRARVTRTSMETWLVGKKTAYHLHFPTLYGKVVPERTKIITKEDKNRVTLILYKEKDSEWKFLKG